jgi:hypothetical protein
VIAQLWKLLKQFPALLFKQFPALLWSFLQFFLGRKRPVEKCVCPPALVKPDPFIYDQYYLTSLGLPVTWDNPDVFIYQGSVLVDPHDLVANTSYTVVARIWNNSTDVPVANLAVNFSYLSFGAGTQSHPIGTVTTDLNAKGLPGCPAFAYITWTTPPVVGHYCLQVLLEPPDDSNWANNLGQRNTDVTHAHSPAAFSFAVGNHGVPRTRHVRFTVDTYTIPPLPTCGDSTILIAKRTVAKSAPPIPPGWSVTLTPNELQLAPGEEQSVSAAITPPSGFIGQMPFNVTARDEYGPIGGVTLTVEVP